MKTKQGILIGFVIILIVITGVVYYVLSSLDSIVAATIEKYGSEVTQTRVTVSSVRITLRSGEGAVSGLRIGNPPGFSPNNVFSLDNIAMKIDTDTVTKDPVVIDEIFITAPYIIYEINKSGASNVDTLNKNIQQYQEKNRSSRKESTATGNGDKKVNLVIRKLIVENGQIDVNIFALGDKTMSAQLPRLQLTDIGKKSGIPPDEVAEQVIAALVKNVRPAVAGLDIESYLGKQFEEVSEKAQQEVGRKAGESLEGVTKEAGEAVKKLFGR